MEKIMPSNPFKLQGYEKFWSVLLGGGMSTAVITLILWAIGPSMGLPVQTPEALTAAITGVIVTLFNAANVFVTANTTTSGEVAGKEDIVSKPTIEENSDA